MSQHTPGPWRVRDLYTVDTQDLNQTIAYCINSGIPLRTLDRVAVANARLIAAAPEMLALLRGCLGFFDDMRNAGVNADLVRPDESRLEPIRALLARIEGVTNA